MTNTLITGGSSGIGKAIALQLAIAGGFIGITGRNENRLKQVIDEIKLLGANGVYYIADVADSGRANEVVTDFIEKSGKLDVLIANAGVGRFNNLEEFTDDDFDVSFNVNVKGVFNYLRPAVTKMKEKNSGQLIVTSSNLGFKTAARCSLYAATKFALQAMIGALREELKGTKVKAGTINPGSVNTPWFDDRNLSEEKKEKMLSPEDVAKAALLMIKQSETSDIDHILLLPGRSW